MLTMKQALSRVLGSAKFWTAIIGLICTAAATKLSALGWDTSVEAQQQIAITVSAMFGILLAAQGAADVGKSAAIEASKAPPSQVAGGDIVNQNTSPTAAQVAQAIVDAPIKLPASKDGQ